MRCVRLAARAGVAGRGGLLMPRLLRRRRGLASEAERRSKEPDAAAAASPKESLLARMGESAATTFASIVVLGLGFAAAGVIYHRTYKAQVLRKMTHAFEPGDPVLELAAIGRDVPHARGNGGGGGSGSGSGIDACSDSYDDDDDEHWVRRPEQQQVDSIVAGRETGRYYLLLGDKGTGKSSMLLEAMRKIDGDGVSMLEAHADLEVVRLRLGKALDYEFHEDYIGGYFSERGPRDTTALLDIERALNKLDKVAMRLRRRRRRPLVLIVNQLHLLRDDDDGRDLIELLQQRAEQWAAANLVTVVFNSDDYWVYERLKPLASRLEVLPVGDLPRPQALAALRKYRRRCFAHDPPPEELEAVYARVGGRLAFLSRVAKSRDMLATCECIVDAERTWFLNQCWVLGADMDDDVMDQQKWAAAAMVLAQALVDAEAEAAEKTKAAADDNDDNNDDDDDDDDDKGHRLPTFAMHEAQQIMTRSDFIRRLDSLNLFTITSQARVRASSVPMHRAFRDICARPGFRKHLDDTVQRISDIESLGRTRELVAKDLVLGGRYDVVRARGGCTTVKLVPPDDGEDG